VHIWGPGILDVIDVRTNSVVQSIPGVAGITGVEYTPGLHKVYTSNWVEEKIGVVDLEAMKVVRRLPGARGRILDRAALSRKTLALAGNQVYA
jgi:hypothetical protein